MWTHHLSVTSVGESKGGADSHALILILNLNALCIIPNSDIHLPPQPTGYCTWYSKPYGGAADEKHLAELAGDYASDEAETTLTVAVEDGSLVVKRRPDTKLALTPIYADVFRSNDLGLVMFRRNAAGRATELSVVQDRVWDLRFVRQPASVKSSSQ